MTKDIIKFDFQNRQIRIHQDNQGNPWFVAKDVCHVLEIGHHHQAVENLDDDERGRYEVPTPGGHQEMITISESGLYTLIMRSNKPQAKTFRKWVTSEVLPSIRKTGYYEIPGNNAPEKLTYDFYGADLTLFRQDEKIYISCRSVAEAIGLAWHEQLELIKSDDVLKSFVRAMPVNTKDADDYNYFCLPLEFLNGWLFKNSTRKIKDPDIKGKLIRYQLECYAALYQHFFGSRQAEADQTQRPFDRPFNTHNPNYSRQWEPDYDPDEIQDIIPGPKEELLQRRETARTLRKMAGGPGLTPIERMVFLSEAVETLTGRSYRHVVKNMEERFRGRIIQDYLPFDGMKKCPKCGQVLPLIHFYPASDRRKHGVQSYCKACAARAKRLAEERKKSGGLHLVESDE